MLIWVKNAPILGKSPDSEVAEFIQKYVTCKIPDQKESPSLYEKVIKCQRHVHNSYCLRNKKNKFGPDESTCRFGFGRTITNSFILRNVQTSISGRRNLKSKSRLYDLVREKHEAFINDFNGPILNAWIGNMDIQYVGDYSTALTIYLTKYILKFEKSSLEDLFKNITNTTSLRSSLYSIGMKMLSHRESGSIEAADTCLGHSLYGTDKDTVIRWLNVFENRSKKIKPLADLMKLDDESTEIFYPHIIDDYYAKRPTELENLSLFEFASWYDVQNNEPKLKHVEYYKINENKFLKKRQKKMLVNHYQFKMNTQPENYFYALLLLFQPWRDTDELKAGFNTYAEAFLNKQNDLPEAVEYHKKLCGQEFKLEEMKKLIEEENLKFGDDNDDNVIDEVLGCVPQEVENAMNDFQGINEAQNADGIKDAQNLINSMNCDQQRIVDKVMKAVKNENEICRLFCSGEAGTGKSAIIKILTYLIKTECNKEVAIVAPTGVASFNVNGMTMHRLFQLPVEHGKTPEYYQLSDTALKRMRQQLKNVSLIIVDEISMVSNLYLMYLNFRLNETFNTDKDDDGFFGKKHILLFGDLLQLRPINEGSVFEQLTKMQIDKYIKTISSFDIWSLFEYDELTINMRQLNDNTYRDILRNLRTAQIKDEDTKTLQSRCIKLLANNPMQRLHEVADYLSNLENGALCILPKNEMCDSLNSIMLEKIESEEINLIAEDVVNTHIHSLRNKALQTVKKIEDSSRTAGLERIIKIKVGAQMMLRRNIDTSLGLVNGAICKVQSISKGLTGEIETVNININGEIHKIERVTVIFEIMKDVNISRKQFPLTLGYAISIHKSQGLSLNSVLIDAGEHNFAPGQIYVALSRVTKLSGLHLINYDPHKVTANKAAILEYNRLRTMYKPGIPLFKIPNARGPKIKDQVWTVPKKVLEAQRSSNEIDSCQVWIIKGLRNTNNFADFANVTIQILFHSKIIRKTISLLSKCHVLKIILDNYTSGYNINMHTFLQYAGDCFTEMQKHAVEDLLNAVIDKCSNLKNIIHYSMILILNCKKCNNTVIEEKESNVLHLNVYDSSKTYTLQELFESNISTWNVSKQHCSKCNDFTDVKVKKDIRKNNQILIIKIICEDNDRNSVQFSKVKIKGISNSKIKIGNFTYEVISAIFKEMGNIHSCMLRTDSSKWTHIRDEHVQEKTWPRNSKGVFILILQQR